MKNLKSALFLLFIVTASEKIHSSSAQISYSKKASTSALVKKVGFQLPANPPMPGKKIYNTKKHNQENINEVLNLADPKKIICGFIKTSAQPTPKVLSIIHPDNCPD